ncbi:MAG: translation initiation factor IF-5A [Candidatus Bathyarchaeota archaeon]|nr:MAG: translation initiation factor IF-5A [Candidatus Bathyarchaeota archaeon]
MLMSKPVDVGTLRVGGYVIVNNEPCRVSSLTKSKPGKHGSAKARVVAIGIFDGSKRTFVKPVDAQTEVPIIEKKSGQVLALLQNAVQIMDLETYEVFEAAFPDEEELKRKLTSGTEVEYWRILGRTKIMRTKG